MDDDNVSISSNSDEHVEEKLSEADFNHIFEETRIVHDKRVSKHVNKKYGTSDSTVFMSDGCNLDDCVKDPTLSTEAAPMDGENEAGDITRTAAPAAAGKRVEVFVGSKNDEPANNLSDKVSHSLCCHCGRYDNKTTGKNYNHRREPAAVTKEQNATPK